MPVVAVLNQKGGTGTDHLLVWHQISSDSPACPEGVASSGSVALLRPMPELPGVVTFPTLRGVVLYPATAARVSIGAHLCTWPFAQIGHNIDSTPELDHATTPVVAVLNQKRDTGKTNFLCGTQIARIHPHVPRESRPADQPAPFVRCRAPERRNFPHLARRVLYPAGATPTPLVHRCANGPFAQIAII